MPSVTPSRSPAIANPSSKTPVLPGQTKAAENVTGSCKRPCQCSSSSGTGQKRRRNVIVIDDDEQERVEIVDTEQDAGQHTESGCSRSSGTCERGQHDVVGIDNEEESRQGRDEMVAAAHDAEVNAQSDGQPAPKIGRWEVVGECSPKIPSGSLKKSVTGTTPERRHKVLKNNPAIARNATADIILDLECSDLKAFVTPLLNTRHPKLQVKVLRGEETSEVQQEELRQMYSQYQNVYVPLLDKMRASLIGKKFKEVNIAICILSVIIRSYVAGFTVHKKQNFKVAGGGSKVVLQCHTLTKSKRQPKDDEHGDVGECHWYAYIMVDKDGAYFTEIESFKVHSLECLSHFARFTSIEVSFQEFFATSSRPGVMDKLGQNLVHPETLYQRKYRMNRASIGDIDAKFQELLKNQEILETISNLSGYREQGLVPQLDEETNNVLLYLSYLKQRGQAETFVDFFPKNGQLEVTSIYVMWKDGKRLLSTHSEAVYLDSIWNANANGYFAQTIVVQDENTNVRLTAICITKKEMRESWYRFFKWVQGVVPTFNPRCIITDGASYIGNSFKEAITSDVVHIVCWWHQRETTRGNYTGQKLLRRICLSIIRSSNKEEITLLKQKGKQIPLPKTIDAAKRDMLLDNAEQNALINLKVFTGGTVTNSYSESINKLLRKAGLTQKFPMLSVLRSITNFAVQYKRRMAWPIAPTDKIRELVDTEVLDKVSNGALRAEKRLLSSAQSRCELKNIVQDGADVQETITHKAMSKKRKGKMIALKKIISWHVNWNQDKPTCSCNALVYSGMPCGHLAVYANQLHKRLPLSCFNPRFFVQPIEEDEEEHEEEGNDDDDNFEEFAELMGESDGEKDQEEDNHDTDNEDDHDDDDDDDDDDFEENPVASVPAAAAAAASSPSPSPSPDPVPVPAAAAAAAVEEEAEVEHDKEQGQQVQKDERNGDQEKDDDVIIIGDDDEEEMGEADDQQPEERLKEKGNEDNDMSLPFDDDNKSEMQSTAEESPVKRCSRNQMRIESLADVLLYKQLRTSAEALVELHANPEFEAKASNLAVRLSGIVEGFALSHCAQTKRYSCPVQVILSDNHVEDDEKALMIIAEDDSTKNLRDELHITSAGLDSRFPSDEMSELRGNLRGLILTLIQLKWDHVVGIDDMINLFHKLITQLVDECTKTSGSCKACLAPVHGRLRSDSYKTVPKAVNKNCRKYLQQARALQDIFISSEAGSCNCSVPSIASDEELGVDPCLEPSLLLPSDEQQSLTTYANSTREVAEPHNSDLIIENQQKGTKSHKEPSRRGKGRRRPSPSS